MSDNEKRETCPDCGGPPDDPQVISDVGNPDDGSLIGAMECGNFFHPANRWAITESGQRAMREQAAALYPVPPMKAPVCANCESSLDFHWPEMYGDTFDVRCPGDDPACSPRADRALLIPEQVRWIEVRPVIGQIEGAER